MFSLDGLFAGLIALITAGMPAIITLLKIRKLTININGRIDELLTVARVVARREGYDEGIAHCRKQKNGSRSSGNPSSSQTRRKKFRNESL